ncbi:MAG TPA: hypothetical protein VEC57_13870 [Candidatus Limnocylindrales bacterium]|nr:hypothetical protein [Candidatus Limnocylindrales bacterium]
MSPIRILAIVLIGAGIVGLAYGTFSFTKETHDARIGPLAFSVQEKETVHVPTWAGAGAIGVGVLMLLLDRRKA